MSIGLTKETALKLKELIRRELADGRSERVPYGGVSGNEQIPVTITESLGDSAYFATPSVYVAETEEWEQFGRVKVISDVGHLAVGHRYLATAYGYDDVGYPIYVVVRTAEPSFVRVEDPPVQEYDLSYRAKVLSFDPNAVSGGGPPDTTSWVEGETVWVRDSQGQILVPGAIYPATFAGFYDYLGNPEIQRPHYVTRRDGIQPIELTDSATGGMYFGRRRYWVSHYSGETGNWVQDNRDVLVQEVPRGGFMTKLFSGQQYLCSYVGVETIDGTVYEKYGVCPHNKFQMLTCYSPTGTPAQQLDLWNWGFATYTESESVQQILGVTAEPVGESSGSNTDARFAISHTGTHGPVRYSIYFGSGGLDDYYDGIYTTLLDGTVVKGGIIVERGTTIYTTSINGHAGSTHFFNFGMYSHSAPGDPDYAVAAADYYETVDTFGNPVHNFIFNEAGPACDGGLITNLDQGISGVKQFGDGITCPWIGTGAYDPLSETYEQAIVFGPGPTVNMGDVECANLHASGDISCDGDMNVNMGGIADGTY